MASSKILFIKGVNSVEALLSTNNADLDNLYNQSDSGFYYVSSGVANSPMAFAMLIVMARGSFCSQLLVGATEAYFRGRSGSPVQWKAWRKISASIPS